MINSSPGNLGVQAEQTPRWTGNVLLFIDNDDHTAGLHFICSPDLADEIANGIKAEAQKAREWSAANAPAHSSAAN